MSVIKPTGYKISQARRVHRNVALTDAHQEAIDDQKQVKSAWVTTMQPFFGAVQYGGGWICDGDIATVTRVLDAPSGKFVLEVGIPLSRIAPGSRLSMWAQIDTGVQVFIYAGHRIVTNDFGNDGTNHLWHLFDVDPAGNLTDFPAVVAGTNFRISLLVMAAL